MKKLILLLIVLMSGCAANQLPQESEKQIKRVGIVSLLLDKANYTKIGITVFNNERSEIDMGGQLNSIAEATVSKRLSVSRPSWKVEPIAYDRTALMDKYYSRKMVMSNAAERIEQELVGLAQAKNLDALIVVGAYHPESSHGDGVGVLLQTQSLSSIDRAQVHSFVGLTVVDLRGKVLASSTYHASHQKTIDPKQYGIKYKLTENFNTELLTRLRADIAENLESTITQKMVLLGL